jgi:hypothetical protein
MDEDLAVAGSAADKFKVVLKSAWLKASDLCAYCRERGL